MSVRMYVYACVCHSFKVILVSIAMKRLKPLLSLIGLFFVLYQVKKRPAYEQTSMHQK
jgi:uncharacterized membrane protein